MTRQRWHLLIDTLMAAAGLAVLATGLLMWFVLPAHSRGATVWSLDRHSWGELHFYAALVVLAMLLAHLAVNWGWVCNVVARLFVKPDGKLGRSKLIAAAAAVVLIASGLTGFLYAADTAKVMGEEGQGRGRDHGSSSEHRQPLADHRDAGRGEGWGRGQGLGQGLGQGGGQGGGRYADREGEHAGRAFGEHAGGGRHEGED